MIVNDCIWMTITIEKQQYNNLNNRIEDNCTTTSDQDDNDSDCNTSCYSNYTLITHNKTTANDCKCIWLYTNNN